MKSRIFFTSLVLFLAWSPTLIAAEWYQANNTNCSANIVFSIEEPSAGNTYSVSWNGACQNGKFSGDGIATISINGKFYCKAIGWWDAGVKFQGRIEYNTDYIWHGAFDDGQIPGIAKWTGPNGYLYEGKFDRDVRAHDKNGKMTFPNGTRYIGGFVNDKMSGTGKMFFLGGGYYEGEFKDHKMHGRGLFVYNDGDRYEGELANDEPHGYGTMHYTNGEIFKGYWANGLRNGSGEHTLSNGEKYTGFWVDNKLVRVDD